MEKVNLGIVGACSRGGTFKHACDALGCVNIQAVCDINKEGLEEAAVNLGASEKYTSYEEMVEAVNIETGNEFEESGSRYE